MKCYKFIACAYLLSDVLPHLGRLSRIFQKESVDLSLIQPCLKTTIDAIKKYEDTPGPNLSKVDDVLATDLKDFQIVATDTQKEQFKSTIQKVYIKAIIEHLNNRFPNVEVLSAFSIFDAQSLPSDEEELASYGQDKLEVLLAHYGEGSDVDVDCEECRSEWEGLKRLMHNNFSSQTMQQMLKLLCTNLSLKNMYLNLAMLATISALIPVSTAECELL